MNKFRGIAFFTVPSLNWVFWSYRSKACWTRYCVTRLSI